MLLSGSLPVALKAMDWPTLVTTSTVGRLMLPLGAWLVVVVGGVTVTVRVAGVGSARPRASVTVSCTVKVPAVLNTTVGFCSALLVAPPPKFQL